MEEMTTEAALIRVAIAMLVNGTESKEFKTAARDFLLRALNEQIGRCIVVLKERDSSGITAGAVNFEQLQKNVQAFAASELLKLWPE